VIAIVGALRPKEIVNRIDDVFSFTNPCFCGSSVFLKRQNSWFQTAAKETVRVFHVYNVEFYFCAFINVRHHKEKPLVVAVGIGVIL
jgi:hypothetical protein